MKTNIPHPFDIDDELIAYGDLGLRVTSIHNESSYYVLKTTVLWSQDEFFPKGSNYTLDLTTAQDLQIINMTKFDRELDYLMGI